MKGLSNVFAYVEGKGLIRTNIGFDGDRIVVGADIETEVFTVPSDAYVFPGFVDEHVHGANSFDAMDATKEALCGIAKSLASEGTCAFLATTMTQSPENITKALTAIKDYMAMGCDCGAEIVGVNLEGPFISSKHVGAQPAGFVAAPDCETFAKYNKASGNAIRICTVAPEVAGGDELVKYLKDSGVVATFGHTDATYADVERCVKLGASNVSHTYNAQRPLHHREAGMVGSAMLFDELNCELIADNIHVSAPAMRLLIKNKPHDKVTLVTDAMRAKALADGQESELGGQKVFVQNGQARLADGTLAGSVLKMNDAIKNVVTLAGVDLLSAIDFASINPAKNIGLDKDYGSIKDGKLANLCIMSKDFKVLATIRGGKVIFQM